MKMDPSTMNGYTYGHFWQNEPNRQGRKLYKADVSERVHFTVLDTLLASANTVGHAICQRVAYDRMGEGIGVVGTD
jgi:hypothetical protein